MRKYIRLIVFYKMVKLNLFMIMLVFFCFICSSSFQLNRQTDTLHIGTLISKSNKLEFGNYTSSNATAEQVASFISFINSASIYFRKDNQSRLEYISDQMNKTYGISGHGFSVIQQDGRENHGSWVISTSTNVLASVTLGVDKIFPNNSYMFIQEPITAKERSFFERSGQQGDGINSTLQAVIKNIILAVQDDDDQC